MPRRVCARPRSVSLRPLRVLAALLLADGRLVPMWALRRVPSPGRLVDGRTISTYVGALRAAGVEVEVCGFHGYRLLALPPDALLMDLLAVLDEVKRRWTFRAAVLICRRRRVA